MRFARSVARITYRLSLLAYPRRYRLRFSGELNEFFDLRIRDDNTIPRLTWTTLANAMESLRSGVVERIMLLRDFIASIGRQMRNGGSNLRALVRSLRSEPGFYLLACLTAAIGIGTASGIGGVVATVLLKPLPYPDSDRMAVIQVTRSNRSEVAPTISRLNYEDWAEQNMIFERMAGGLPAVWIVNEPAGRTAVFGSFVTSEFFSAFAATPAIGRLLVADDFTDGAERVGVVSHEYWMTSLGGDSSIVGSQLQTGDESFTVVGVTAPDWVPPAALNQRFARIWVPINARARRQGDRDNGDVYAAGVLRDDVSLDDATILINDLQDRVYASLPDNTGGMAEFRAAQNLVLTPIKEATVGEAFGSVGLLVGATVFLLLLAAANVGNMFIARGVHRNREFAVRTSLGGNRATLSVQLLAEGLLLGLATALLAIPVAAGAINAIAVFGPEDLPRIDELGMGLLEGSATVALCLSLMVAASLAQLVSWRQHRLLDSLRSGQNDTSTRFSLRLRTTLVIVQVASSVVLLVGGGLLLNSYVRLINTDPGFEAEGLAHARMFMVGSDDAGRWNKLIEIRDRVSSIPGVTSVAVADRLPMTFGLMGSGVTLLFNGETYEASVALQSVSRDYFKTMKIDQLAGSITSPTAALAANQALLDILPSDATFGELRLKYGDPGSDADYQEIAGVFENTPQARLGEPPSPMLFEILEGEAPLVMYVVARYEDVEGTSVVRQTREAIRDIDPDMPVEHHGLLIDDLRASVVNPRFYAMLTFTYSIAAALLTCTGIFAALSQMVLRRRREIGIRMALGASERAVLHSYLWRGAWMGGAGILIGLPGALILSRFIESRLYEITTTDPATLAAVSLLMIVVSLAAAWSPARKATSVDPVTILREE